MSGNTTRFFAGFWLTFLVVLGLTTAGQCVAGTRLPQANGDSLTLNEPARVIVTLAPNLAELVYAAGAGERLKGVVEYSNFPPQVQNIPRVGDAFRIDLERIIALGPDLVIAWASGNPQSALQKLEQLGFNVWQLEITHPAEIADAIENISHAAGTQGTGAELARELRQRLALLQQQNADKSPVDYFYQVSARPLYTINGSHIISRGLEICGANNVFGDLSSLAPQVSRESVILANPQAMIAPEIEGDAPALNNWQEWPQLHAVQNRTMLYLPADEISQATPRLLDSIGLACQLLDEVRTQREELE